MSKNRTRVKICGITSLADALIAVDAGVDALGFVFAEKSPRNISFAQAQEIIQQLPPFVTTVALFVNAPAEQVQQLIEQAKIDTIQFHGDEPAEFCQQFTRPYYKAIRMHPDLDLHSEIEKYASASAVLLDAYHSDKAGGTGEVFDWERIPNNIDMPVILAGGLKPANAKEAALAVQPYALDVSSGVEVSPGKKSSEKIYDFIKAVSEADRLIRK